MLILQFYQASKEGGELKRAVLFFKFLVLVEFNCNSTHSGENDFITESAIQHVLKFETITTHTLGFFICARFNLHFRRYVYGA